MTPLEIEEHVLHSLRTPTIARLKPYPMFYAENVFPQPIYDHIMDVLADKTDYGAETSTGHYGNRAFAERIDIPELSFMVGKSWLKGVMDLFAPQVLDIFPDGKIKVARDIRLIRDSRDYKIGPHTDASWKLISLLFYLPRDDSMREYGTSIFLANDPDFRCKGGPHYKFEETDRSPGFTEFWRAPFMPNTCLGFWKTDHSFHGVYPIPEEVRRDVLLYNVYREK